MTAPDALIVEYLANSGALLDMVSGAILDMSGNPIYDAGEWVSLVDDVLGDTPIVIFQGQKNSGPTDRVAESGSIRFSVRNDAENSGGLVGYYSPGHTNVRSGWELGAVVRIGLEKDGTVEYISQGRIVSLEPTTGGLNTKTVDVVISDWIEIASRTDMPWISLEDIQGMSDDGIIQEIVASVGDAPNATDFEVGSYEYEYPLTDLEDAKTKVMTVFQRLMQNGLGRLYVVGNSESGEVLKYISYDTLVAGLSVVSTFDNDFETLSVSSQAYRRAKRINVKTKKYNLYSNAFLNGGYTTGTEYVVGAGATIEVIGEYKDMDGHFDSGGNVPCVAVTPNIPWGFSSTSGGFNNNLLGQMTVVITEGVNKFKAVCTSSAVVTGYLVAFVYGDALISSNEYLYTVEDDTIAESQGVTINWDAIYRNSYADAVLIGDQLMSWHGGQDFVEVKSLVFTPSLDATNYNRMIDCKPGTMIHVTDDVSGVDADVLVVGFELQIWSGGSLMRETLYLSNTV